MLNKELVRRLLQNERRHNEEEANRWSMLQVRAARLKQPLLVTTARQGVINCNRTAQDCVNSIAALARI